MVDDQEEYEVEKVISHWYYGHKKALQYLIHWKGYSVADDTWEPADQVFMDTLMRAYHRKYPPNGEKAPTFTTHLCAALAKSHWHPQNPLMNNDWSCNQTGLYWGPKDLCPYGTYCIWYHEEHVHPHAPCCSLAHQTHCWSRCLWEKCVKKVYSQGPS